MKATLFDYGAGNLHSLSRALVRLGLGVQVSADATAPADLLVLPGVGAFGLAADCLASAREVVRAQVANGQAVLGICLGMQLLFDASEEDGGAEGRGLAVFAGSVTRLRARVVPHIGWTRLEPGGAAMYFAHSYACRPEDASIVRAYAQHDGDRFAAVVQRGAVAGVQFHPEKSSADGLDLLAQLVREVAS